MGDAFVQSALSKRPLCARFQDSFRPGGRLGGSFPVTVLHASCKHSAGKGGPWPPCPQSGPRKGGQEALLAVLGSFLLPTLQDPCALAPFTFSLMQTLPRGSSPQAWLWSFQLASSS